MKLADNFTDDLKYCDNYELEWTKNLLHDLQIITAKNRFDDIFIWHG